MDYGLKALRATLADAEAHAPSVSAWPVGMHVAHCCLATNEICRSLLDAGAPAPGGPTVAGRLCLTFGRIPRGRGRAPESVRPPSDVRREDLPAALDESGRLLVEALGADPRAWYRHFVFGVLDRDRSLRFVAVHNRHHLRIIADVVAAAGRRR